MAGTLYVTEYASMGIFVGVAGVPGQIPAEPPLAEQTLATGATSAAFNAKTVFIRVHAQTNGMSILISTAGTAAAVTNHRLAQNQTEYLAVPKGQSFKINAIDNA
jgi:hypothetical protein